MLRLLRSLTACAFLFLPLLIQAQDKSPVSLRYDKQRINDSTVVLSFHAAVNPGLRLYHLQQTADEALYSEIAFDSAFLKYLTGSITEKGKLQTEKDAALDANGFFLYRFCGVAANG